jgi:molybdopterin-synthase adenylyltransferase
MNERYSRQILFREIGRDGQQKLLDSRVLLVGCGALGAAQAEMLARAGVGNLRIVDRDFVEFTNLQRQTLFKESDAAERLPKAVAAKTRIAEINSEINVEAIIADVNNSNVEQLIDGVDIVIDGTDNFQVRYLLNDACAKHQKTWIYGAAVSSYGTTMTIIPGDTPCLRCIFDEMPDAGSSPTCDTAGVIMPIIATVAATQVSEALKILVGDSDALHRSLMQFDVGLTTVSGSSSTNRIPIANAAANTSTNSSTPTPKDSQPSSAAETPSRSLRRGPLTSILRRWPNGSVRSLT